MKLQQYTIAFFLLGLTVFYGWAVYAGKGDAYDKWSLYFYLWYKLSDVALIAVIWKTNDLKYFKKQWRILFWFCIIRFLWQVAVTVWQERLEGRTTDIVMFIFWCLTLLIYGWEYNKQQNGTIFIANFFRKFFRMVHSRVRNIN